MVSTLKACLALGVGAAAGVTTSATTYAVIGIENVKMNDSKFREGPFRRVDQGDDSKVLKSLKDLNDKVESGFRTAEHTAIGVGGVAAAAAAAAAAALLPSDSELGQGGVGPGYVAGRQQRDNPNSHPLNPHTFDHLGQQTI